MEPLYYYARASFHQGKLQNAADLFAKASEVNSEDYQSRRLRAHVIAIGPTSSTEEFLLNRVPSGKNKEEKCTD